ncbi:hypothetical protein [Acidovorax sp. 62]|uniref:hypothetical protein n=1 Tax=Acidovorax sp. 62 TaxID=2035203 RepID=UPI001177F4DC|nr:hypothetical protein [Acidovorax sp. 62]
MPDTTKPAWLEPPAQQVALSKDPGALSDGKYVRILRHIWQHLVTAHTSSQIYLLRNKYKR